MAPAPSIFVDPSLGELDLRMRRSARADAAVRLVNADFLIAQHERGEVLLRRQDMPAHAFYDGPIGTGSGVTFIAVSYAWLSKDHSDPDGFHLATLAPLLAAFQKRYRKAVVFIDFCSLFQRERDDLQAELFQIGLGALTLIYGHQHTTVWCLSRTPPGIERGYGDRGWWCACGARATELASRLQQRRARC